MGHRGWKYRCYADEPDHTPVQDFVCGFLGGTMGIYGFPGWLFVGLFSQKTVLIACAIFGLLCGCWLLRAGIKEIKRP